jgi:hypothetical protein
VPWKNLGDVRSGGTPDGVFGAHVCAEGLFKLGDFRHKDENRRPEVGGQRSETDRGQKSEVSKNQRSEIGDQKSARDRNKTRVQGSVFRKEEGVGLKPDT